MKGWNRKTWMGCVVAVALGASWAHAQSGTISFAGAIVAPTCGGSQMPGTADASIGGCGLAMTNVASYASIYRQTTVSLEDAVQQHDRLLSYFATYADAGVTRLVTRTYL